MTTPPTGTITFLFTDLERSAHQWEQRPWAMEQALARHDALVRDVLEAHGGFVFKTVGDAVHAAFATAPEALHAAVSIHRSLAAEPWETGEPLRARIALHTGTAQVRDGDYFGPTLNRVARLRDAGYGGQILLSAVTAGLVRGQLPVGVELRDLGDHRLRDLSEPEQVYQAAVWGLPADFPPLRTEDTRPTNLPTPLTSFVGREEERGDVARLLERARLVTLTGPGGTGKTRLALAVAERVRDRYPDGVWFADLSAIVDPELVASAVAQVLDVRESEGRSLADALVAYLREKCLLLVLDNFEQVVEAAPLLRALLSGAAGLTLLVTSRVVLHVTGEHEYAVPPLPLPGAVHASSVEDLANNAAVALFVERARAVKHDFAISRENAGAVAEICTRLDGLPLAIELAASRIRLLSPDAIRARLDERLTLLTGGARDLPARQRTLRDTIRWSYDLLDEAERRLVRRLAVFAGGWSVEAAEAICDADGGLGVGVFDGLGSLVEQSLVRQEAGPDDEPRFRLLDTIREFAAEQLAADETAAEVRRAHAAYYLTLAEAAHDAFPGPRQSAWLQRLETDYPNLRAALGWLADRGATEEALRLATSLAWTYWVMRGLLREAWGWLRRLLAQDGSVPPLVRARALVTGTTLANSVDEYRVARAWSDEAAAVYRAAGTTAGAVEFLVALAILHDVIADFATAHRVAEEAVTLARETDDAPALARALAQHGHSGWHLRRYAEAQEDLRESAALLRGIGDRGHLARVLMNRALVARDEGDHASARTFLVEGIESLEGLGAHGMSGHLFDVFASLAALEDRPVRGARLLGAAAGVRERVGLVLPPAYRRDLSEPTEARIRASLDSAAFAAAYEEGRTLSLDAAIALALEQAAADA